MSRRKWRRSTSRCQKEFKVVDYYDQSDLIDHSVRTVTESLIEGEVLVLIILLLLLGDFRGSLITAAAIPFCMFVAFILMWYSGSLGESHFTRRVSDQHRHDGRCHRGDGGEYLPASGGTSGAFHARDHSGRGAGDRAADVFCDPDHHRGLSACFHAAGNRRQAVQAACIRCDIFDDRITDDGAVRQRRCFARFGFE